MVPSSARATQAPARPLPQHLVPLLGDVVDAAHRACTQLLPPKDTRTALDNALWETDPSARGAHALPAADTAAGELERELLQQSFQKARVYRPRFVLHGAEGMGQPAAAAALLHKLEGYHVQTLSAASLLGDSSQTPDATLVQQLNEARRLKPSILFVPELDRWPVLLSENVRETFEALLGTLQSDDAVLLLGVSATPLAELPREIQRWFGILPANRAGIPRPSETARHTFFEDIARQAARPPSQFADGLPRRRRTLPELPKAPPQPPRMPTEAELKEQVDQDARLLEHLKYRLGPVLAELRKKFKKFTRDVWDEYNIRELTEQFEWRREKGKIVVTLRYDKTEAGAPSDDSDTGSVQEVPEPVAEAPGEVQADSSPKEADAEDSAVEDGTPPHIPPAHPLPDLAQAPLNAPTPEPDSPYILRDFTIYTMTLEKMQKRLYYNAYLTCDAFMNDLNKIVANAEEASEVDADRVFRARQMQNLAKILLDQYIDAPFRAECAQMAERVLEREALAKKALDDEQAAQVHPRRPNGQRYSARVHGEDVEVDTTALDRAHKRTRSTSQAADEADGDADEAKRRRPDETPEAAPAPVVDPEPVPSTLLSLDDQARLTASLVQATSDFSVEQLEQVRAACYGHILEHRTSWDRTALYSVLSALGPRLRDALVEGE